MSARPRAEHTDRLSSCRQSKPAPKPPPKSPPFARYTCPCLRIARRMPLPGLITVLTSLCIVREACPRRRGRLPKDASSKGDVAVRFSREPSCMCMRPGRSRYACPCLEIARLMPLPGSDVPLRREGGVPSPAWSPP